MDAFTRDLLAANDILENSKYISLCKNRYASFDSGSGRAFEEGQLSLEDLYAHATAHPNIKKTSGQQELFENIINQYI
jgi:xylose isomerase